MVGVEISFFVWSCCGLRSWVGIIRFIMLMVVLLVFCRCFLGVRWL